MDYNKTLNLKINSQFVFNYLDENNISLSKAMLNELINKFTKWEDKYVYSLPNGYEDYRDNIVWLDYDEILKMYIDVMSNSSMSCPDTSMDGYQQDFAYFKNDILPQIESF